MRFFYGTRRQEDLYHVDTMAAWTRTHPNFSFVPVLSDEPADSDWTGERGLVTEALARNVTDAFGAVAFMCGPPPMIDAAIPVLRKLGIDREDIHYDKFTPVAASVQRDAHQLERRNAHAGRCAHRRLRQRRLSVVVRPHRRASARPEPPRSYAIDGARDFWEPLATRFRSSSSASAVIAEAKRRGRAPLLAAVHRRSGSDRSTVCGRRTTLAVPTHCKRSPPRTYKALRAHWDGILLFDPPLAPPEGHRSRRALSRHDALARGARARRREFTSPEELAANFGDGPHSYLAAGRLEAMALATLACAGRYDNPCAPTRGRHVRDQHRRDARRRSESFTCSARHHRGDPTLADAPSSVLMARAAAPSSACRTTPSRVRPTSCRSNGRTRAAHRRANSSRRTPRGSRRNRASRQPDSNVISKEEIP